LVYDYYNIIHPSGTTRREFILWVTVFSWQFSLNRLPGHQRVLGPTNSRRRDGWPTRSYYDCARTNQTDPPSPGSHNISLSLSRIRLHPSPRSFSPLHPVVRPAVPRRPIYVYSTNPSPLCPQLLYIYHRYNLFTYIN